MSNATKAELGNEVEASTPFHLAAEGQGVGLLVLSQRDVPPELDDLARSYVEMNVRNARDRHCFIWDWYERNTQEEILARLQADEFVEESRAKAVTDAMAQAGLTHFVAGGRLFIDLSKAAERPARLTPRAEGEDITGEPFTELVWLPLDPPTPPHRAAEPASAERVPSKARRPRGLKRRPAGRHR